MSRRDYTEQDNPFRALVIWVPVGLLAWAGLVVGAIELVTR